MQRLFQTYLTKVPHESFLVFFQRDYDCSQTFTWKLISKVVNVLLVSNDPKKMNFVLSFLKTVLELPNATDFISIIVSIILQTLFRIRLKGNNRVDPLIKRIVQLNKSNRDVSGIDEVYLILQQLIQNVISFQWKDLQTLLYLIKAEDLNLVDSIGPRLLKEVDLMEVRRGGWNSSMKTEVHKLLSKTT
jgi:hypothetical protein